MNTSQNKPKVVVLGPIHQTGIDMLTPHVNLEFHEVFHVKEDDVIKWAQDAVGIIWKSGGPRCTEKVMEACKNLRVVGRYGAGIDLVDLEPATRLGVCVVHAPGANSIAVAEHAMMLMLNCIRGQRFVDVCTRAGNWRAFEKDVLPHNIVGKTLGIVGVGSIGRQTATRANAFGMKVYGFDPYVDHDELVKRGVTPCKSMDEMLAKIDILTFHCPLTPETKGMINSSLISKLKKGAILINTSRGGVQDEKAIYEALRSGHLAAAGIDVWEVEPVPADNPLLKMDNVICTPHIAGMSAEANEEICIRVAKGIIEVVQDQRPTYFGNPKVWENRRR